MTGEYRDDKKPRHSTTMFSKFHQQHHQHHQQTPPLQQHFAISGHQFQLSNNSEEADSRSRSPAQAITPTRLDPDVSITGNDGASIELVRRPRGRPPGSKNKPKPPIFITREPEYPCMSPYVLELPGGSDIVAAVNLYCRKRNMGLCVLTGSGTVTNVSLRQPTSSPGAGAGATVTFQGRFDILSISATVFPSLSSTSFAKGFTISLAGPQGQVVGGPVAGPLMAGGPVYIIAASFNNPVYHRLPSEEDDDVRNSGSVSPPTGSVGGESGGGHHPPLPPATAADAMSMYSSGHLSSDVIWAPTPRQAPPHQPPYLEI